MQVTNTLHLSSNIFYRIQFAVDNMILSVMNIEKSK